jgi:hypothetical protein
MDEQLATWHPTESEVNEIVRELRPLIRGFASRDRRTMADEVGRRHRMALACR